MPGRSLEAVKELISRVVYVCFLVVSWYHYVTVQPIVTWWLDTVVSAWEESVKALLRECFATATRLLNGASAWAVSVFFKQGFYEAMRSRHRRPSAWKAWWAERAHSTFGAVLEREGLLARRSPSPALSSLRRSSGSSRTAPQQQQQPQEPPDGALQLQQGAGASLRPWWQLWRGGQTAPSGRALRRSRVKRSGSELFERPSGYGIAEAVQRRGLLEDARLGLELAVTAVFDALRATVRAVLFLPRPEAAATAQEDGGLPRRQPGTAVVSTQGGPRPCYTPRWEDLHVWTASDVIVQAGYPLEEHIVTTQDGYVLHMQRIPRKGARDVAFFMHGILDTSLGWVANGVVGSQAFAAWDAGHDVWLGNSRSNPPYAHVDPGRRGARYWAYTLNELGTQDVAAQVEHIHMVKTGELQSAAVWRSAAVRDAPSEAAPKAGLRRTASDSELQSRRRLELAGERGGGSSGGEGWSHQLQQPGGMAVGAAQHKPPALTIRLPPGREFYDTLEGDTIASARSAGGHGGRFRGFRFHPFKRSRRRRAKFSLPEEDGQAVAGETQEPADKAQPGSQTSPLPAATEACKPLLPPCTAKPVHTAEGLNHSLPYTSAAIAGRHSSPAEVGSDGSSVQLEWFDAAEDPSPSPSPIPRSEGSCCSSNGGAEQGTRAALSSSGRQVGSSGGQGSCAGRHIEPSDPTSPCAFGDPAGCDTRETSGAGQRQLRRSATLCLPTEWEWAVPAGEPAAGDTTLLTPDRVSVKGVEHSPGPEPTLGRAPPTLAAETQAHSKAGSIPGLDSAPPHPRSLAAPPPSSEPYRLRAVAHSLGAASMLIYAVTCRLAGRPHRLRRLVLLTPAGFHVKFPRVFVPFIYVVPLLVRLLGWLRPGTGFPAYLPSSLLRHITFKLSMDLDHIPGLSELTKAGISALLSGDQSQWDRALQMPHYNTYSMPSISSHTGDHLMQLMKAGRFLLYDYGSLQANLARYGIPRPPDVAASYGLLADLPVDLVAGRKDGIIAAQDVMRHYQAMRHGGMQVSYKEFDVGHLDVTFAVKDDIRHYVLSRLQQQREWLQ